MTMCTGDLKTQLCTLGESIRKLRDALGPLEEILEAVQSFHDIANEFYREQPFAKKLELKGNPFHAVLGVGKVTDQKAENVTLGQLIAEIKTLSGSSQAARELVTQANILTSTSQLCQCGIIWVYSEDQTACPSCGAKG